MPLTFTKTSFCRVLENPSPLTCCGDSVVRVLLPTSFQYLAVRIQIGPQEFVVEAPGPFGGLSTPYAGRGMTARLKVQTNLISVPVPPFSFWLGGKSLVV